MHRTALAPARKVAALLIACSFSIPFLVHPAAGMPRADYRQLKDIGLSLGDQKPVIIVLKGPSLSERWVSNPALALTGGRLGRRLQLENATIAAELTSLRARQNQFEVALLNHVPAARVVYRYEVVLNAMAVILPASELEKLNEMDQILYVAPVHEYFFNRSSATASPRSMALDTSNPLMGAAEFWAAVGGPQNAGAGVKIGIIDSGVDFTNPMFIDPTMQAPAGFPRGDLQLATGKVIVAKYFQSMADSSNTAVHPGHRTAQDLDGHGSHSASCAAGNFFDTGAITGARPAMISGVAPKAYIGSYRVFAPRASTDNVLAGIEDAVRDGMDVLNLSFGSLVPSTQTTDPMVDAVNNASRAGVVVCVAGGNGSTGPFLNSAGGTINSPANASEVISVGASTNSHDGFSANQLANIQISSPPPPGSLSGLLGLRASGGRAITSTPITGRLVDVDLLDNGQADRGGLACDPFAANSLNGTIALIQQGQCLDLVKAFNAYLAGATGIIFYNSEDQGEAFSSPALFTLPLAAVSLPRSIGLALKSFVDQNAAAGIPTQIGLSAAGNGLVFDTIPQQLAEFSSRGPTTDFQIKPDLLAPGTGSYAAAESQDARGENRFPSPDPATLSIPLYDPTGFLFTSGTSFSAPRAAGAAALLRQLHPDWSSVEIKSALMGMASRPSALGELGTARVMDRGTGTIDLRPLPRLHSVVQPPSLSLGRQVGTTATSITKRFMVTNKSIRETTYQFTAMVTQGDPSVSVRVEPAVLVVGAGQSGAFFLTVQIRANIPVADTDSEGFVTVFDGQQTIPQSIYVPFWLRTASK